VAEGSDEYLAREARARKKIDQQLAGAGWIVQSQDAINLHAGSGVAVREVILEKPHGRADYVLFAQGRPVGVIEAKAEGTTLTEVEHQSAKYVEGLPAWMQPPVRPLPFIYESTGTETRFTNGQDPDARSRRVFSFHRPETLLEWIRKVQDNPSGPTLRARLRAMPELDEAGLWSVQARAIRNLEVSLREDRPRAVIQMATGSGKTFTAANISYRLIRHANASRVLFLVDRSNLGRQTKQPGLHLDGAEDLLHPARR
jgi:type I restriction enzyme R subunit